MLLSEFFDGTGGSIKKESPCPTWDKSFCFCGTTQLDVCKRPLALRAITRTPWVTGGDPVGIYLVARSSRPQKAIRLTARRPDHTARDSLGVCLCQLLLFLKGFDLFCCYRYLTTAKRQMQEKFFAYGGKTP